LELNGLEQKILSLAGTEKKTSSDQKTSFHIDDIKFINCIDDHTLKLYLNEACKAKLSNALKSEPRAAFDNEADEWVTLTYHNEVDIEFIFLYIRYSWKSLRSGGS